MALTAGSVTTQLTTLLTTNIVMSAFISLVLLWPAKFIRWTLNSLMGKCTTAEWVLGRLLGEHPLSSGRSKTNRPSCHEPSQVAVFTLALIAGNGKRQMKGLARKPFYSVFPELPFSRPFHPSPPSPISERKGIPRRKGRTSVYPLFGDGRRETTTQNVR